MHVRSVNTADRFEIHGVGFQSFFRSQNGSHHLGAWQADFAPGTPGVPHRMSVDEIFRVLSGRLLVEIEGERAELAIGDAVIVPAGALFRVSNETTEPASAWIVTPVGMEFRVQGSDEVMAPPWAQ